MYPLSGGLETAEGGSEGYKWEPAGLSEAAHCSSSLPQNLTIVFLLRLQPGIAPDFTAPHIMDWPVSQIQYLVPGLNSSNTLFDLQHHCWQLCGAQQVRLIMDFPTSTKVSYETLESCVRYRWLLATTTRNSTDNDNDASYVNCDRNFDENDDKNDQKHINIMTFE